MKFDDTLGENLHTALRKACDSKPTSAAWNIIYLLKAANWKSFLKCVEKGFEDLVLTGSETEKERDKILSDRLQKVVLKWEPYGQGHDAVALFCAFELFSSADWQGFGCWLSYSIKAEKTVEAATK